MDKKNIILKLEKLNYNISIILLWSYLSISLLLMNYIETFSDDLIPKDVILVSILLSIIMLLMVVFSSLINSPHTVDNILSIVFVIFSIICVYSLIPVIGSEFDSNTKLINIVWNIYSPIIIYYCIYLVSFGMFVAFLKAYNIEKKG